MRQAWILILMFFCLFITAFVMPGNITAMEEEYQEEMLYEEEAGEYETDEAVEEDAAEEEAVEDDERAYEDEEEPAGDNYNEDLETDRI